MDFNCINWETLGDNCVSACLLVHMLSLISLVNYVTLKFDLILSVKRFQDGV